VAVAPDTDSTAAWGVVGRHESGERDTGYKRVQPLACELGGGASWVVVLHQYGVGASEHD
jgi:hypothetical protein